MIKQLHKVGNSSAITLDKALMDLVGLKEKDSVQVTVQDGTIVLVPVHPHPVDPQRFAASMEKVLHARRKVLRRLAQ